MKTSTRIEAARKIRDHILPVVQRMGSASEISGIKSLSWEMKPWLVMHRTPFGPTPTPETYRGAIARQKMTDRRYALDIWHGRKVLNIEWDSLDNFEIVSFKRGQWEDELIALALNLEAKTTKCVN